MNESLLLKRYLPVGLYMYSKRSKLKIG